MYRPASSAVGTASTVIVGDSKGPDGPGITALMAVAELVLPVPEQAASATIKAAMSRGYVRLPMLMAGADAMLTKFSDSHPSKRGVCRNLISIDIVSEPDRSWRNRTCLRAER
jgi:hypothetical protein